MEEGNYNSTKGIADKAIELGRNKGWDDRGRFNEACDKIINIGKLTNGTLFSKNIRLTSSEVDRFSKKAIELKENYEVAKYLGSSYRMPLSNISSIYENVKSKLTEMVGSQ